VSTTNTAKKKQWNEKDKEYSTNWSPGRVDWTASDARAFKGSGGAKRQQQSNQPPKKLFGLF